MKDLKIGIHLHSCEENKFSANDFIELLKIKLDKFNPSFFIETNSSDAYYEFGYTQLSVVNLEELERNEIIKIIKNTFIDLKNNR